MPHLLDIEYRDGHIILWIKQGSKCTPHRVGYYPRIYLECPVHNKHLISTLPQVRQVRVEQKITSLGQEPQDVLAISLDDWDKVFNLEDMLEQMGWKAYNVDLPPTRQYLLENGLFPMAQLDPQLHIDDDQQDFARIMDRAREHASASTVAAAVARMHTIVLSILIEQQKQIDDLKEDSDAPSP